MRKRLIQMVHIAKHQLAMNDEAYRAVLKRVCNKRSSTQCSLVELQKVLKELQGLGANVSMPWSKKEMNDDDPVKNKILWLWGEMRQQGFLKCAEQAEEKEALNAFVRRCVNKNRNKVLAFGLEAIGKKESIQVLEMLKQWHKRLMLKWLEANNCEVDKQISYNQCVDLFFIEKMRKENDEK